MITITTVNGNEYCIKSTDYFKNARELIKLLTDDYSSVKVNWVETTTDRYISAKYIVSIRDTNIQ